MTFEQIKNDEAIRTYIARADETLDVLEYTEHSFAHVGRVAYIAGEVLRKLNYPARTVELAQIAGYLHDIGNLVNRIEHSQSGAVMAFRILDRMGFPPDEIATVVSAIGNHDEGTGVPVNPVAAALILADKSDVRRTRVRSKETVKYDIHDRVNYSVTSAELIINEEQTRVTLELTVDTSVSSVMEYFEIFTNRMILCRKAAHRLNLQFGLVINGQQVL